MDVPLCLFIECPPDFTMIGRGAACIKYFPNASSWWDARDACSDINANLIMTKTLAKFDIMNQYMNPSKYYIYTAVI